MNYHCKEEGFSALEDYYNSKVSLLWPNPFMLPPFLKTWWDSFGHDDGLWLKSFWNDDTILGIAPLKINGEHATFIGSSDLCDYGDFIVNPEEGEKFAVSLFRELKKDGVRVLDLGSLRPESIVLSTLLPLAEERDMESGCVEEDRSVEVELPDTFEKYLAGLKKKQRHEVRRKMRGLAAAGELSYHVYNGDHLCKKIDELFDYFIRSRDDKASFLTHERVVFFKSLCENFSEYGLLKLGIMELDRKPAGMVLYFDFNDRIFLYNSAYDPEKRNLSVGLNSKMLSLKDSIVKERHVYDFLKGTEDYKMRLGGRKVPLFRCVINIISEGDMT